MSSRAFVPSVVTILAVALVFSAWGTASAETLLGNVTVVGPGGKKEVYPVVSGGDISYGERALIRITGGTFVAEPGSELQVVDQGELLNLRIDKGTVHFRIQPQKAVISFLTRDGSFVTPEVVKASNSFIEGTVTVNGDGTVIELSDGELVVMTPDGPLTVNPGDRVHLVAQSEVDDGASVDMEENPAPEADAADGPPAADGDSVAGAAVFGTVAAGAITGAVIGATTGGGGGGDSVASPIE